MTFLPEKYVSKINKIPEFYIIIAREKYFSRFFFGGEARAPLPPVSYAYVGNDIQSTK